MIKKATCITAILLAQLVASLPVTALTAQDVMEKMEEGEAHTYLFASIEMAAFLARAQGDDARSKCILDWWLNNPATDKKVLAAFDRYPDRQASAILYVLMNRACGEPKTAAK
jgi:hypothetical protein